MFTIIPPNTRTSFKTHHQEEKGDEETWKQSLINIVSRTNLASVWDTGDCPQHWITDCDQVAKWLDQDNDDSRSRLLTWMLHLSPTVLSECGIVKIQLLQTTLNQITNLTLNVCIYSTSHELISLLAEALSQNTTITHLTYNDSTEIEWACLVCEPIASNLTSLTLAFEGPLWSPENSTKLTSTLQQMHKLTALRWLCTIPDSEDNVVNVLVPALNENASLPSLHRLDLSGNQLGDAAILKLVTGLKNQATLAILNLAGNGIKESTTFKEIANLLNKEKLTHLYLDGNIPDTSSIGYIASALKTDKKLAVLSLTRIEMDEEGANKLEEVVQVNSTLTHLLVHRNQNIVVS